MKRTAQITVATLLLGALTGCGSVVTDDASASSASSSGNGGGGGSTTSTTSTTSSSTGSGGSGGSGGSCSEPNAALTLGLVTADGTTYGCGFDFGKGDGDIVLQGQVHGIAADTVVLDTCPPGANCAPTLATLSLKADSFALGLPEGAFVELRMHVETPMGCGAKILITNLATWEGAANPVSPLPQVLLAASDGLESTFPEAPFAMDTVSVCTMGPAGGAEAFAFRFFAAGEAPGSGITVPQGGSVIWSPPFEQQSPLMIRNLRSFESGFTDDYWNWAYLMVPAQLGD